MKKTGKTKSKRMGGKKKPAKQALMQCDSLIAAIKGIQRALEMTGDGGKEQAPCKKILAELGRVRKKVCTHISLSEGPEGLLSRVDVETPRLSTWVRKLRAEHRAMEKQVAKLDAALVKCKGAATPRTLKSIRDKAVALLEVLESHQEKGTELVFEAYLSDVGTKD